MRDSMIFFRSYVDAAKHLPDEQRLKFYDAIIKYGLDLTEPELDGVELAMFTLIKPIIDRQLKSWENGNKGGRPKTQKKPNNNPTETQLKPKDNPNETQQYPYKDKDKDNKYTLTVTEGLTSTLTKGKELTFSANGKDFIGFCNDDFLLNRLLTAKDFNFVRDGKHQNKNYSRFEAMEGNTKIFFNLWHENKLIDNK